VRTRSCRSATRQRGLPQGRGSAPRRTRAVSACPTRATRLARCRQRALPPSVSQCQLDRTACDRCGTRRVGRARWGGAGLPRGAPGRSRRAQGARHALPEASSMPYTPAYSNASSTSSLERDASAGRCGAVWDCRDGRSRVVEASFKGPQELHRLHECIALRRHPWHSGTSLLEEDERPARRPPSVERVPHRDGGRCVTHRRSDGTSPPQAGAPARDGVLLACSEGGITRV